MSQPLLVMAAGGTGGHMFPAQALAEHMLGQGWRVKLFTDERGSRYTSGFPQSVEIETVASATFARGGILAKLLVPIRIAGGILAAARAFRKDRPDVVVGFGGYPSIPALGAAVWLDLPRMIHEQNGVLGRVNQLFAKRVDIVACGIWPTALPEGVAAEHVGNPVRSAIAEKAGCDYSPTGDGEVSILVIGGSQGASILSDVVPPAIAELSLEMLDRLKIAQQARPEDLDRVRAFYSDFPVDVEVESFFHDIPERLAAAQLVIARAGASTVADISVVGRPSILIPLAAAIRDEQTANARMLVDAGAAVLAPEAGLDVSTLSGHIGAILTNPGVARKMARKALGISSPDAASHLSGLVERLAAGQRMKHERRKRFKRFGIKSAMKRPATKLPIEIGPVHFVGIGGIGMSGIAEVLLYYGYSVQGSDLAPSKITERLEKMGAEIFIGQKAENLANAEAIVISSAISPGNPELDEARAQGLPVVRRAEMLAELMRLKSNIAVAGTHGKTTTTTLIATLLDAGGIDPTVINGGIIHAYGSNARMGKGEWMVVEADESDGTFNRLPTTVAIVTNIDPEHMEHWGTLENLRQGFRDFVSNIPFYGLAICCTDHPEVRALVDGITDRRVVTFGFNEKADIRAINLQYSKGVVHFDIMLNLEGENIEGCALPMPGDHNVSNALAAVSVARHLGVSQKVIRDALANFKGVNRRFTKVGEWNDIAIIDDYGHHPVEIAAVLKAARQSAEGRVIAVHQPHRYSRLSNLFQDFCGCFDDADIVAIADVFAAGEEPIPGADRDKLVAGLISHGHPRVEALQGEEGLAALVREHAEPGDIVVCLGAGTIGAWANALPEVLGAP